MVSPRLVAKAALFNDNGEILIIRRSSTDKKRPGQLDLPGGGVQAGENYIDAVLREIKEEIGVELKEADIELGYTATMFYEGTSTVRLLYVGRLMGLQAIELSYEHDAYYWLPLEVALAKYDHPVWMGGLKYLSDNNLF